MVTRSIRDRQLLISSFILILLIFIGLSFVFIYLYHKWKRIKASVRQYKRKILRSIPHIEHPEYNRMKFTPLTSQGNSFDKELAITLISTIMSTYNISSKYNPLLPSNVTIVKEILPNAVLYKMNNVYILSFRGTMTAKDLIADFDISQTQFKGSFYSKKDVLVHQGFYNIWETHKQGLKDILDKVENNSTVYITGHSLGSALAAYTALDYSKCTNKALNLSLYVFAPPRVGNQYFIDELSKYVPNNWAHINMRDIVCDLPPTNCPTFTTTYLYDDFRQVYRSDYQSGEILSNHHLESYLNCLEDKQVEGLIWNRPSKIIV